MSPPRAPQSCKPACAEGHNVLDMEAVFFNTFPCFESSPAQPSQPGQGLEGIQEGSTNLQPA